MAKEITYKDVDKENYSELPWVRDNLNEQFKNYKIINVETLESVIRFWYYKED